MADYIPLISKAVEGLEKNTGENRRALYERARVALVQQLRGVDPPLSEGEITRERLALEDAIRRTEEEAVKQALPDDFGVRQRSVDEERRSLRNQGLRNFRETVSEAQELGRSAADARRVAWQTYERVPGENTVQKEVEAGGHHHDDFESPHTEAVKRAAFESMSDETRGVASDDFVHASQPESPESSPQSWPPAAPGRLGKREAVYRRPPRDFSRIVKIGVAVLLVFAVAALGYSQRRTISSMVAGLRSAPAPAKKPATPAARPKIVDRVGPSSSDTAPKNANAPAIAVAQKVVLYEEDAQNPQGQRFVGSAVWRTETVSPGAGLAPELAIRADVEIPDRHMRMTWSLRRNTDKALPASHTAEIIFTLPSDFAEGGIGNVPGVLMKQGEQARGVPLAGLAVKVTNGYFLIGLSAVDVDKQRNVQLLKERDWFDIPVVYTSGKRAILALEKGTPGARAFEEAFRAWGE